MGKRKVEMRERIRSAKGCACWVPDLSEGEDSKTFERCGNEPSECPGGRVRRSRQGEQPSATKAKAKAKWEKHICGTRDEQRDILNREKRFWKLVKKINILQKMGKWHEQKSRHESQ